MVFLWFKNEASKTVRLAHDLRPNGKTPRAALDISEERRPLIIEIAEWLGAPKFRRSSRELVGRQMWSISL